MNKEWRSSKYGRTYGRTTSPPGRDQPNKFLEAYIAFSQRITPRAAASKMVDVWPIENVWAILKDRTMEREPKSKQELNTT